MNPPRFCAFSLTVILFVSGCSPWQIVNHRSRLAVEDARLEGKRVRVTTGETREVFRVTRVLFPILDGEREKQTSSQDLAISVNLRRVDLLEAPSGEMEGLEALGAALGVAYVLYAIGGLVVVGLFLAGA